MRQQEPSSRYRSPTREACDRTTGQRARTSQCDDGSGRCSGSGQRDRLSGSSQHMPRSTTLSTSVAISSRLQRSVGSGPRLSRHGVPLRALLPETTFNYNQVGRTQQRDKPLRIITAQWGQRILMERKAGTKSRAGAHLTEAAGFRRRALCQIDTQPSQLRPQ